MSAPPQRLSPAASQRIIRGDVAYILPMAVFLLITEVGNRWKPLYPASYIAKTIIVAILLAVLWPNFAKIRWGYWWLGIVFGIVGIVQWIGLDVLWFDALHHVIRSTEPRPDAFNPLKAFYHSWAVWGFIAIRLADATLVVPMMEELFWRDFLWRMISAPNDFQLAEVGERDWRSWLTVSIVFSFVHGAQWPTAIVWGLMIGGLLMITRRLGPCIIMHGVTNLLLGLYVLKTGRWYYW